MSRCSITKAFLLVCFSFVLHPSHASAEDADATPAAAYGLTGDWGGARKTLQDRGVDLNAVEILDFMGNTTGGTNRGLVVEGIFQPVLDLDFEKMAQIEGFTAHASAMQIHGRGLSASNLNNNIATSTGIEAERATRLFELWAQKEFLDGDVSVRAGEMAADQEFITSRYASLFMNSVYGWPSSMATNLISGGPGYPMAAPGVRLRIGQSAPWAFQVGVYDGDPAGGPGDGSVQHRNPDGARFALGHGALVMSEADYARNGKDVDLPSTYKVGMWYHTENFADQREGTDGLSLADPSSNGVAKTHHGNYGFYGVVDQTLWHAADNADKNIAGFMRFLWNPDDRNVVAYQLDAGVNFIGMVPGRENDIFGVAMTYLPITSSASGFDRDNNVLNGNNAPVRNFESQIELTYQAHMNNWLTIQPEFQYMFHPGGNVANPNDASGTESVGDAVILGVRAIAYF